MKYLLDTDYVIDFLVEQSHAVKLMSSLGNDRLAISIITVGEILEGVYYGRNPQQSEALFQQFLAQVDTLFLTHAIMKRFAHIRGDLRRKGQIIGDFDILIAATAIHHNLTLITRNFRDYIRIPDLQLYQEK